MAVKKYQKRPVVIEALEITPALLPRHIREFYPKAVTHADPETGLFSFEVETLEGMMWCRTGDFLIKGIKGEFYPCKPDIFRETYDEIDRGHFVLYKGELRYPYECQTCGMRRTFRQMFSNEDACPGYNPNTYGVKGG